MYLEYYPHYNVYETIGVTMATYSNKPINGLHLTHNYKDKIRGQN